MDEWISRPISVISRMEDFTIVRDTLSGDIKALSHDDFALLNHLRRFGTKELHTREYHRHQFYDSWSMVCNTFGKLGFEKLAKSLYNSANAYKELPSRSSAARKLIARIDALESAGLLISRAELDKSSVALRKQQSIPFVAVPTSGRPANLGYCLESILANRSAFGRHYSVIVSDDSDDLLLTEETKACAQSLSRRFGGGVQFIDRRGRRSLVSHLEKKGFDKPMLEFALLGVGEMGERYGANRNSLGLLTMGSSFVSCDDDVVLPATSSPLKRTCTFDDEDPFVVTPFVGNIDDPQSGISQSQIDFMAQHELYLGRSLSEMLTVSQVSRLCAHSIVDITTGSGEVLLASCGVLGDSGMSSGSGIMLSHNRRLRNALASNDRFYNSLLWNRNIARKVDQFTIVHHFYPMTTCFAMHGTLAIPFFPAYRQEDRIFGFLFGRLFPHGYSVAVPASVLHRPANLRTGYKSWIHDREELRVGDYIVALIRFLLKPACASVTQETIGSWLTNLGSLSASEFVALCNEAISQSLSEEIETLTRLIEDYRFLSSSWVAALISRRMVTSNALMRKDQLASLESRTVFAIPLALYLRELVSLYGGMLLNWTDIKRTVAQEVEGGSVSASL